MLVIWWISFGRVVMLVHDCILRKVYGSWHLAGDSFHLNSEYPPILSQLWSHYFVNVIALKRWWTGVMFPLLFMTCRVSLWRQLFPLPCLWLAESLWRHWNWLMTLLVKKPCLQCAWSYVVNFCAGVGRTGGINLLSSSGLCYVLAKVPFFFSYVALYWGTNTFKGHS